MTYKGFRSASAAVTADVLPPVHIPRSRPVRIARTAPDVVDAEFEIVPQSLRSAVPPVFNDNRKSTFALREGRPVPTPIPGHRFAARGMRHFERLLRTASPEGFTILVALLCVPVFLVFAGLAPSDPSVRLPPASATKAALTVENRSSGTKTTPLAGASERPSRSDYGARAQTVDIISGGRKRTVTAGDDRPMR